MKKKALSLALALVMCLGLTVPAFAEEAKVGDTSVSITDSTGLTVTLELSGPILGVETVQATGDPVTVYQISSGTVITPVVPDSTIDGRFYKLSNGHYVDFAIDTLGPSDGGDGNIWWPWDFLTDVEQPFADGKTVRVEVRHNWPTDSGGGVGGVDSVQEYVGFHIMEVQTADPEPTTPPAAEPAVASPTNDALTADGVLQPPTVYKINGSNYFKIRDLAAILNGTGKQFSVGYDSELKSVTATTGQGYEKQSGDLAGAPAGGEKTAEPSNDAIYINGEKVEAEVYKIDGSNYFKLRDLGKALDFYVGYSAETGVFLETDKPYSE